MLFTQGTVGTCTITTVELRFQIVGLSHKWHTHTHTDDTLSTTALELSCLVSSTTTKSVSVMLSLTRTSRGGFFSSLCPGGTRYEASCC